MNDKEIVFNIPGGATIMNFSDWSRFDENSHSSASEFQPVDFFEKLRMVTKIDVVVRVPTRRTNVLWITRDNHGIMMQKEGIVKYQYGSCEFIVQPGDIFYFPKGIKYKVTPISDYSVCVCTNFQISEDIVCFPRVYHMECSSKMDALFNRLNISWLQDSNSFQCMHLLYGIMAHIYDIHTSAYASPQKKSRFKNVREYIENHFTEPNLSVQAVADNTGLSSVYIRKLFAEFAHMSPTEYITSLRMNYAKALLQEGSMSISQVSKSVGYFDCGHFSKKFKLATKLRPTDFKLKYSNE